MTDHIKVEDSFVDSILENASWDAAHLSLSEKKDSGAKKGDEGAGEDKDDKSDYTTDARKGDKSKTHKGKDFEKKDKKKGEEDCPSVEVAQESVEEHICPLCESVLEEAITDEQVREHVAQIANALETIEEDDEALDEDATEVEEDVEVVEEASDADDADNPANKPGYKSRDQQSAEYHEREAKRMKAAAPAGEKLSKDLAADAEERKKKVMDKVNKLKATAGGN